MEKLNNTPNPNDTPTQEQIDYMYNSLKEGVHPRDVFIKMNLPLEWVIEQENIIKEAEYAQWLLDNPEPEENIGG